MDVRPLPPELAKEMTSEQYARFLRNRAMILKLTHRLLRPVSFSREKINSRMDAIDTFVIQSARAISQSVRTGFVFSGSLSFGLGVSDKLVARIKSERLRRLMPKSGGFYYVIAAGFGIFVRQSTTARRHLVLEVFADVDRLDKVHTYAAEVSLAVNWGIAVDRSKGITREKLDSHYVGILGVIRKSAEHFSFSLITGLALPPYLPIGMVYSNVTTRFRASLITLPLFNRAARSAERAPPVLSQFDRPRR